MMTAHRLLRPRRRKGYSRHPLANQFGYKARPPRRPITASYKEGLITMELGLFDRLPVLYCGAKYNGA